MNACRTDEDYAALIEASRDKPVFLLKHSTRCPGSRVASIEYLRMEEADSGADYWLVLVVECRGLSMKISESTGIAHESPQVLLFMDGEVVWHASHNEISVDSMMKALSSVET